MSPRQSRMGQKLKDNGWYPVPLSILLGVPLKEMSQIFGDSFDAEEAMAKYESKIKALKKKLEGKPYAP